MAKPYIKSTGISNYFARIETLHTKVTKLLASDEFANAVDEINALKEVYNLKLQEIYDTVADTNDDILAKFSNAELRLKDIQDKLETMSTRSMIALLPLYRDYKAKILQLQNVDKIECAHKNANYILEWLNKADLHAKDIKTMETEEYRKASHDLNNAIENIATIKANLESLLNDDIVPCGICVSSEIS